MKKNTRKNWLYLSILAAVILLLAISIFYKVRHSSKPKIPTTTNNINYSPPTDAEKAAANSQKEVNVKQQDIENNQSGSNSSNQSSAEVFITYAGEKNGLIEVNAFTSHYEDGVCTIIFSKGTAKVTKQTPAYKDASTTICTNPSFKRSDFPASGEWQLQVEYSSPSIKGQSATQTITIS